MNEKKQVDVAFERLKFIWINLSAPVIELARGVKSKSLPLAGCCLVGSIAGLLIAKRWDSYLFNYLRIDLLYPTHPFFYWPYAFFGITSGFWLWALVQVARKRQLTQKLTDVFTDAGLKSSSGRLPNFIFDVPLDDSTRKLRLSRGNLKIEAFKAAKSALQGGLQIFIDEIRENIESGTVDIVYAYSKMDDLFEMPDVEGFPHYSFLVGKTRSETLRMSLADVPHLLVAGQTGGGKSTFLRQFITTLYTNNAQAHFSLIDLKGGLEFQLFENLSRIEVFPDIEKAVSKLRILQTLLTERMKILKANNCKDLTEYEKLPPEKRKEVKGVTEDVGGREIVVVDEASEMFLAGQHADTKKIQEARRCLSQIARQGRAVGVHLVIATQRPDTKSLDPQVKANLPGVVCFQMVNDASSITVLGSGRATELSSVPGRAIWKCGARMVEVQTPLLETAVVEKLFAGKRKPDPNLQGPSA